MSLIVVLLILLQVGAGKPTPSVAPPAPSITVSFERQNIRQKDCVNVDLLISNPSDLELTNTSLEASGPFFLNWYTGHCEGKDDKESGVMFGSKEPLPLGSLAAQSHLRRELHFHSSDTIEVGEYNLLFTVPYEWKTATKTVAKSFVSAEKPVKFSFLGSESVAGIPLALAGFIVPGLLFWLIVSAFGASWSKNGFGDQLIYSVVVSVGLVVLGAWLKWWDISTGISIDKLTRLAGAGAILGALIGGADLGLRKIMRAMRGRELGRQITLTESEDGLLGKLLELPPPRRFSLRKLLKLPDYQLLDKPIFTIKGDGKRYAGALGARTTVIEEGGATKIIYSVVGSFEIDPAKANKEVSTRLRQLNNASRMCDLVKLAKEKGLLENINGIREVNAAGVLEVPIGTFKVWSADEISDVVTDTQGWGTPALSVK